MRAVRRRWPWAVGVSVLALTFGIMPSAFAAQDASAWRVDQGFLTAIGTGATPSVAHPRVSEAYRAVEMPDGDVMLGGFFGQFNGTATNGLVRLNPDGSVDTAYQSSLRPGPAQGLGVTAMAVLPDGGLLVAGITDTGYTFEKLLPDGSVDTAFQANVGTVENFQLQSIAVLTNGDILLAGFFTNFNGTPTGGLVKLHANGTIDTAFQAAIGTGAQHPISNAQVSTMTVLADGDIMLGGSFQTFNGTPVGGVVRLNADGTMDTAFQSAMGSAAGTAGPRTITELADGDIMLGGFFTTFNGSPAGHLVRLTPTGAVNTAFNSAIGTGTTGTQGIWDIAQLDDGTLVLSGPPMGTFNGSPAGAVYALNNDGTPNPAFQATIGPGVRAQPTVFSIEQLSDGDVMFMGDFGSINGIPASRVARMELVSMHIDTLADQSTVRDEDVTFPVAATVSDGTAITYSATGLPDGVVIDPSTGVISGAPTTSGAYTVTVTATAAGLSVDTSFAWDVAEPEPTPEPTDPTDTPTDPTAPPTTPSGSSTVPGPTSATSPAASSVAPVPDAGLPRTGSALVPVLLAGLGLAGVGVMVMRRVRQRP